ncbi:Type 1 glutamine amidotransferase-like domain-containing protein [Virgibacillus flavescens]|uniref:Type 1 glutamine amidotransferase-like domain-containing protein n=1 Tax=Virgibacillus flavescens TaxID=1611422 RepID=UPI003D329682
MNKHLFLYGGGPPFTSNMAKKFVALTEKTNKPVSILFVERTGWREYIADYTDQLRKFGFEEFHVLPLPSTPISEAVNAINNSSGIIINGGDTNKYADYIVDTPISDAIQKIYDAGGPVAGFSAGALISPEVCIISGKDNEQSEFQQRNGLGLLSTVIVAVHFSEWNDKAHLRAASAKYPSCTNYGIDEGTCIYMVNGEIADTEGAGVYSLKDNILYKLN